MISFDIAQILEIKSDSSKSIPDDPGGRGRKAQIKSKSTFINADFTINFKKIQEKFLDSGLPCDASIEDVLTDYEKCLSYKRTLDPLLNESYIVLQQEIEQNTLAEYSNWIDSPGEFASIVRGLSAYQTNSKYIIAAVLRLTALLEWNLGNLYSTIKLQKPPHLLRDILAEFFKESRNGFFLMKYFEIFTIQIFFGTAYGVNLRNLVWHGFLDSVDIHYATFIVVVILSIGKKLKQTKINARYQPEIKIDISFPDDSHNLISSKVPFMMIPEICDLQENEEFEALIVLLLVRTESVLRDIYSRLNNVSPLAKLGSYYIIFDTIFYEFVLDDKFSPLHIGNFNKNQEQIIRKNNPKNKIFDFFPRSLIHLGFDMFHAHNGPRVRDKISHGEIKIKNYSKRLFEEILYFHSLVLQYIETNQLPLDFEYHSIYMDNLKFLRFHNVALKKLNEVFSGLKIPSVLNKPKLKFQQFNGDFDVNNIKCFFRPLNEKHIIKLLLIILENFQIAIEHFEITCSELFQAFESKKLGSSGRKSAENLINFIPNFYEGFVIQMSYIKYFFSLSQNLDYKDDSSSFPSIKLLKKTVELTEHLKKHFHKKSRNFFVANEKITNYVQMIKKECIFI